MTISPRAIEAAARALCVQSGDDPDKLTYAHAMQCTGHDREPKFTWQYWMPFAEAALSAALAVDGVALVPREPTQAMIIAGCENNPTQWNEGTDLGFAADVANDVYRAMVSAAQNRVGGGN